MTKPARFEIRMLAVNAVVVESDPMRGVKNIEDVPEAFVAYLAQQRRLNDGFIAAPDEASGPLGERRLFFVDTKGQFTELLHDGKGKLLGVISL